ncbi:MAG TPA: VCBS repeat-containing protein, partial [Chitinophagaceae bacterium]
MGKQLGIKYFNGEPYENIQVKHDSANNVSTEHSIISLDAWKKILDYYKSLAPGKMRDQDREPVLQFTNLFITKKFLLPGGSFPSTSYIKIDPGNHWIYAADAFDSSINIYNTYLQRIGKYNIHGVLIDMQFSLPLQQRGERSGVLTNIGIMNPNDLKTGTADTFYFTKNASLSYLKQVLDSMPRPVQTASVDLDKDGKQDYLVCGFGNTTGALYWVKNEGNRKFEQKIMRPLPGAIKAYIDDYNHDGLPDIMVLMAQAWEGIYLFTNKGNGMFDTREVLQFPAVYGSSYFELD